MTALTRPIRRLIGRPDADTAPVEVPAAAAVAADQPGVAVDIPESDPLFAFLQSAPGPVDLTRLDTAALWQTVREWYVPDADEHRLDEVLAHLRAIGSWPSAPYDGSRASMAALKNLTSDLIGRFCGAVQEATFAAGAGPFVRYAADLVVPDETMLEIAVLKGIAAHYVMRADGRVPLMERQRTLIAEDTLGFKNANRHEPRRGAGPS